MVINAVVVVVVVVVDFEKNGIVQSEKAQSNSVRYELCSSEAIVQCTSIDGILSFKFEAVPGGELGFSTGGH